MNSHVLKYPPGDVKDEGTVLVFGALNVTSVHLFLSVCRVLTCVLAPMRSLRATYLTTGFLARRPPTSTHFSSFTRPIPPQARLTAPFSPQYKRLAAVFGDWFFCGPRRLLLDEVSANRTVYNFCAYPRLLGIPKCGTHIYVGLPMMCHASERSGKLHRRRRRESTSRIDSAPYS